MARYLQQTPPQPPEFGMKEMKATWKVIVPPEQRPTKKMNNLQLDNLFSVTLRDAGQIALIDGDTKKIINIVKTGYAVHISRLSASGRYLYVIGRDAKINLIDLWMEKPDNGRRDQGRPGGALGRDLQVQGLRGQVRHRGHLLAAAVRDHEGRHAEAAQDRLHPRHDRGYRRSTIPNRASPRSWPRTTIPSSSSTSKETGKILLVNYKDLNNLKVTAIDAARFLHDGGWDSTGRYFLVAANKSNKIAVVDYQGRQAGGAGRRRQDPAPGPRRELRRSEVSVRCGRRAPGRRTTRPDRHRPGEAQGQRMEGRAHAQGPGRRFAVHQDHPKSKNLWVDTRAQSRSRRSASRSPCTTSTTWTRAIEVLPIAEMGRSGRRRQARRAARVQQGGRRGLVLGVEREEPGVGDRGRGRQDAQAQGGDQGLRA